MNVPLVLQMILGAQSEAKSQKGEKRNKPEVLNEDDWIWVVRIHHLE